MKDIIRAASRRHPGNSSLICCVTSLGTCASQRARNSPASGNPRRTCVDPAGAVVLIEQRLQFSTIS
jgi:hypothetical protein